MQDTSGFGAAAQNEEGKEEVSLYQKHWPPVSIVATQTLHPWTRVHGKGENSPEGRHCEASNCRWSRIQRNCFHQQARQNHLQGKSSLKRNCLLLTFVLFFILLGLHSRRLPHSNNPVYERVFLVQFVQTLASRGQDQGLLPHSVHAIGPHVRRSLHYHYGYLHSTA